MMLNYNELEPARRTKLTHPYSYDPFTVWRDASVKVTGTVYTDRLIQWDHAKHDELSVRHFGNDRQNDWAHRDPAKIEAFLRDYLDAPTLRLGEVIEYCNVATGYPVWRLDYATEPK